MFRKKNNDYAKMPPVNLDQFDDPIALNAQWTPFANDTIASYVKLETVDNGRLEFRPILAHLLINAFIIFVGIYAIITFFIPMAQTLYQLSAVDFSTLDIPPITLDLFLSNPTYIFVLFFGLIMLSTFIRIPIAYCTTLGRFIYVLWFKTPIIDQHNGYIWKGRPWSNEMINPYDTNKKVVDFQEIYAIQLLPVMKKTKGRNQHKRLFYQLNLVLHSAERYGLALYANPSDIRKEAKILAKVLNVPVWDVA